MFRVPANLRMRLDAYEGRNVNELCQDLDYTMNHHRDRFEKELLYLLSFVFRSPAARGMLTVFQSDSNYKIEKALRLLYLEKPLNGKNPVVFDFCLARAFTLKHDNPKMQSCDVVAQQAIICLCLLRGGICGYFSAVSKPPNGQSFMPWAMSEIEEARASVADVTISSLVCTTKEMETQPFYVAVCLPSIQQSGDGE